MSGWRCIPACLTVALAGTVPAAAQQNDYGGYDIYGSFYAAEHPYAQTRGWQVYAGKVDQSFAYCVAQAAQNGGRVFRLGWDGMQWQLAVPVDARKDWEGTLRIDGQGSGRGYRTGGDSISGTAKGGWAIAWLGEAELDGLRKGSAAVLSVGDSDYDFSLAGSTAAILKIQECVGRAGSAAAGTGPVSGGSVTGSAPVADGGERMHNGAYRFLYAEIGDWEVWRFTQDPQGQTQTHCVARMFTGSEQGLRFAFTPEYFQYGVSGYGSAAIGNSVPVTWWFDGDRSSGVPGMAELVHDEDGYNAWLSIKEQIDGPGIEEAFVDASTVSAAYSVDGTEHVETFPLKDSRPALVALFDCGHGQ